MQGMLQACMKLEYMCGSFQGNPKKRKTKKERKLETGGLKEKEYPDNSTFIVLPLNSLSGFTLKGLSSKLITLTPHFPSALYL